MNEEQDDYHQSSHELCNDPKNELGLSRDSLVL